MIFGRKSFTKLLLIGLISSAVMPNDDLKDLELLEDEDINLLLEDDKETTKDLDLSRLEEIDDLEALKQDVGETVDDIQISEENQKKLNEYKKLDDAELEKLLRSDTDKLKAADIQTTKRADTAKSGTDKSSEISKLDKNAINTQVFEVGNEEKTLLDLAKYVEKKIPVGEWDEIAAAGKVEKYVIQEGEWLWKISEKLFGSGFYYSKIWAMNPQITNPHEVEPGQVLVFNTGSSEEFPEVKFGSFDSSGETSQLAEEKGGSDSVKIAATGFNKYGDDINPQWLSERKKLVDSGVFFQYLTESNYEDVLDMDESALNEDFRKYDPPISEITIVEPGENYDEDGVDRTTKLYYKIKEGFYLNTFVTTNHVQDLGKIAHKRDESVFVQKYDRIYIEFDKNVKVRPGDQFSVYYPQGKISHKISDREGYKYTTVAQIKALRPVDKVWEVEVTDLTGLVERGARVTVFTPKINKIFTTFNKRTIEAAIVGTEKPQAGGISMGDVVYIDRGRVDGVELGNVFEAFSFRDKGTGKKIANNPAYTIGELVVITLTDNFATALVTQSSSEIKLGSVLLSKTHEKALREKRIKDGIGAKENEIKQKLGLEELDVELNLDDLSQDLLDRIDEVQINEDELEELERQEREKSIIKEHERDLKELEKLEKELVDAETKLNERKVDEDEFLENQNLEDLEKKAKKQDPNAFASVDELEAQLGKKYMDEDINSKENPYGLTEFDLEEIDELLNTGAE